MTTTRPPSSRAKYSSEAQVEHGKRELQYGKDLERLSRTIAKQKNSDDVQKRHVEDAASALSAGSNSVVRIAEIGLVIAGFGFGYLGNVILSNEFDVKNVLIFMIPIMIGACMYTYALGRK